MALGAAPHAAGVTSATAAGAVVLGTPHRRRPLPALPQQATGEAGGDAAPLLEVAVANPLRRLSGTGFPPADGDGPHGHQQLLLVTQVTPVLQLVIMQLRGHMLGRRHQL